VSKIGALIEVIVLAAPARCFHNAPFSRSVFNAAPGDDLVEHFIDTQRIAHLEKPFESR
jgi:hypothetical protein